MRFALITLLALLINACDNSQDSNDNSMTENSRPEFAMVIHGGAGTITRASMTPDMELQYLAALNQALDIGEGILNSGGSSIDAVEQVVMFMEDSPLFNAGRGSVFTHDGKNEMDASIMDGATQNAGAVGGVSNIRNPITLARAVMEQSEHVMLVGVGAEEFARIHGISMEEPEYFYTERRWNALERIREKELKADEITEEDRHGTVGAVALDKNGNLAAATSTGGMTNKKYDRIGDSPIIGAGTYADNNSCAVSATGHGEYFIRYAVAHDIAARMEYGKVSLQEAANAVVLDKLVEKGGSGGVIALDHNGNVAMPFNSEGMYRGYVKPGERVVKIYKD